MLETRDAATGKRDAQALSDPPSPRCHTSPERQHGEWPVGLVAGVTAQSITPEVMVPQVPQGCVGLEVLRGHIRGRSGQPHSEAFSKASL